MTNQKGGLGCETESGFEVSLYRPDLPGVVHATKEGERNLR